MKTSRLFSFITMVVMIAAQGSVLAADSVPINERPAEKAITIPEKIESLNFLGGTWCHTVNIGIKSEFDKIENLTFRHSIITKRGTRVTNTYGGAMLTPTTASFTAIEQKNRFMDIDIANGRLSVSLQATGMS